MEDAAAPPLGPPNPDVDGQDQPQDQDNDNNTPDDNQGILPNQPAPQPLPALPAGPPIALPNQPAPQPALSWPQPLLCQPPPQIIHQQMVNWSNFKPKSASKPEEDAEVHLLFTNDWMQTHNFEANVKVQRFCFTLLREARLWYETLNVTNIAWLELQNAFRQQYSNLSNTPEQYFHQWRSFYFDENADSIDSYVTRMSQCAAILNYGEPQILELLKNTLHSRLYPMLFPIDNFRDAMTTAK